MHCTRVNVGGTGAIICGPRRIPVCSFCRGIAGLECDFPIRKGKTCDRKICRSCAIAVAPNVDFCPDHPAPDTQLAIDFPTHV